MCAAALRIDSCYLKLFGVQISFKSAACDCNNSALVLNFIKLLQERIAFKILLLTLKLLHRLAPSYLSNLVKYNSSGGRDVSLHCPINHPPRAFSSSAPRLWNNLPQEITKCVNIKDFKGKLKAHLFRKSFDLYNSVTYNRRFLKIYVL